MSSFGPAIQAAPSASAKLCAADGSAIDLRGRPDCGSSPTSVAGAAAVCVSTQTPVALAAIARAGPTRPTMREPCVVMSTRVTVSSMPFATQTAPPPAATARGSEPTGNVVTTRPVRGSIIATVSGGTGRAGDAAGRPSEPPWRATRTPPPTTAASAAALATTRYGRRRRVGAGAVTTGAAAAYGSVGRISTGSTGASMPFSCSGLRGA